MPMSLSDFTSCISRSSQYSSLLSFHRAKLAAPCLQQLMTLSLTSLPATLCNSRGCGLPYTHTHGHIQAHTQRHSHTHRHQKYSFTCENKTPIPNIFSTHCVVFSCCPYRFFSLFSTLQTYWPVFSFLLLKQNNNNKQMKTVLFWNNFRCIKKLQKWHKGFLYPLGQLPQVWASYTSMVQESKPGT